MPNSVTPRNREPQATATSRPADQAHRLQAGDPSDTDYSQHTVQDVFEIRRILEPGIAALAAERASEEDICHMEAALDEQREQTERGESGVSGDTAFHFALAKATNNAALIKVVMAVADTLHQSRDRSLQTAGRAQRSLASHRAMLELVRSQDCEGARKAMEHHISVIETSHTEVESAA